VASGLFIAALLLLVATSVAISLRDRPLLRWLARIELLVRLKVDDTVFFLGVLLLFDVVAVGLLVRFGSSLS
jgi:hypothetical protein